MSVGPDPNLTRLLNAAGAGDSSAFQEFWARVNPDLRAAAARLLRGNGAARYLQATEIVDEAWMRYCGNGEIALANRKRRHRVWATSAQTMSRLHEH